MSCSTTYRETLPIQDIAAIKRQHSQVNRQNSADESNFECDNNKKVMIIIVFRLYGRLTCCLVKSPSSHRTNKQSVVVHTKGPTARLVGDDCTVASVKVHHASTLQ